MPSTASGQLTLSLPHEALVTNPVSTSPESVAFTGELQTDSAVQPNREVACALMPNQDTAIGRSRWLAAPAGGSSLRLVAGGRRRRRSRRPRAARRPPSRRRPRRPRAAPPAPPRPRRHCRRPAGAVAQTVLAAEPIPPATVAQGLRLPPWAMLFVGAFVAGGLFLALASHRRLRQLTAGAFVVLALLVVPTPLNPSAPAEAATGRTGAAAATGQAQTTLICVYEAEGSDSSEVPKDQPTGLSITLDVPASVTPGEVLTLTGSASVQAPEDIRNQASQLGYTTLDAISDCVLGGAHRRLRRAPGLPRGPLADRQDRVQQPARGPGTAVLPLLQGAGRRQRRDQAGAAPQRGGRPEAPAVPEPQHAAEGRRRVPGQVTGNGTSATYIVSCWRNDNGSGLIATIPVFKDAGTTPGTTLLPRGARLRGGQRDAAADRGRWPAGDPADPASRPGAPAPARS